MASVVLIIRLLLSLALATDHTYNALMLLPGRPVKTEWWGDGVVICLYLVVPEKGLLNRCMYTISMYISHRLLLTLLLLLPPGLLLLRPQI